jgi:hypothetical protein
LRSIDLPLWKVCHPCAGAMLTEQYYIFDWPKDQNIHKGKFSTNRVIDHSGNHGGIIQTHNKALLCIVPIFSYVTPKGTLNGGKQEGLCARFAFCSGCGFLFNVVSEQLSSLMLHVTAAYRKLIMWLLTCWSKQT